MSDFLALAPSVCGQSSWNFACDHFILIRNFFISEKFPKKTPRKFLCSNLRNWPARDFNFFPKIFSGPSWETPDIGYLHKIFLFLIGRSYQCVRKTLRICREGYMYKNSDTMLLWKACLVLEIKFHRAIWYIVVKKV